MKRLDVALSQLIVNPSINPRHTVSGGTDDDVSDLVAQIRANGFSDALWVREVPEKTTAKVAKPKGKAQAKTKAKKTPQLYEVIDGSRRLRALRQVADELKLKTIPVDVIEADDAKARELALAANVARSALSPADEAQAFASLKLGGLAVAEIAARFAVPERRVRQRIALGTLAPAVLEALRRAEISIETAQAFTLTPARERQEKLFAELKKKGELRSSWAVKEALAGRGSVRASDGRVKLVGLEAYAKAGGSINEDLFGDRTALANEKLLDRLFAEKVEELVKRHKADGWSWVKLLHETSYMGTAHTYAKVEPRGERSETKEQKRARLELEARAKKLQAEYAALDDKDMGADGLSDAEEARKDELAEKLDALEKEIEALKAVPFTAAQKAKLGVLIHVTADDWEILLGRKSLTEGQRPGRASKSTRGNGHEEEDEAGSAGEAREPEGTAYSEAVQQLLLVAARNDVKLALVRKPALAARLGLAHRIFDVILANHGAPFVPGGTFEPGGEQFTKAREEAARVFEGCDSFASVAARLETLDPQTRDHLDAIVTASLLEFGSLADEDVRAVMALADPAIGAEGFRIDADFLARLNRRQLSLIAVDCGIEVPKGKKPDMIASLLPAIGRAAWLPAPLRTPSWKFHPLDISPLPTGEGTAAQAARGGDEVAQEAA